MATFHELTTSQLKQALQIREQIETLQQKLETLLGGTAPVTTPKQKVSRPSRKRTISEAGRAKIAAAQRARWASKQGSGPAAKTPAKAATPTKAAPAKSAVTAERRAKLSAAMKARWAERKKTAAAGAE